MQVKDIYKKLWQAQESPWIVISNKSNIREEKGKSVWITSEKLGMTNNHLFKICIAIQIPP